MVDPLLLFVFSSAVSVGLLFLPALIELRKPQDAGPRLIPDFITPTPPLNSITDLPDEEEKSPNDPQVTSNSTESLGFISNIET